MNTYAKNIKVCATCAFWGGSRTLDASHVFSKVNSNNDLGYCSVYRLEKMAFASCGKWEAWPSLK